MSESPNMRESSRPIRGWLSSVPRCHAVGASLAIALIFATAWIWSLGHTPASTFVSGQEAIDMGEAMTLIKNADQWRELDAVSCQKQDVLRLREQTVDQWLPASAELNTVERRLLSLGEECELHVFSVREGERTSGSRVRVLMVSCEIQGSFPCVCRFLHHLSRLEHPIACSELRLQRSTAGTIVAEERHAEMDWGKIDQPCKVTLTLRVPYVGNTSVTDSPEDRHAA